MSPAKLRFSFIINVNRKGVCSTDQGGTLLVNEFLPFLSILKTSIFIFPFKSSTRKTKNHLSKHFDPLKRTVTILHASIKNQI